MINFFIKQYQYFFFVSRKFLSLLVHIYTYIFELADDLFFSDFKLSMIIAGERHKSES